MSPLDTSLLQWLAAGEDPGSVMLRIGSSLAVWGSGLAAAVLLYAFWRRPRERPYILGVFVLAAASSLISHAIAARLNFPRPFVLGLVPAYIGHSDSAALPSTHATVMFAVAFAFLLRQRLRGAGLVLLALAAATGWARIYVGVHFPFDILAGIGLAGLLAAGFALVLRIAPIVGLLRGRPASAGVVAPDASEWRPS